MKLGDGGLPSEAKETFVGWVSRYPRPSVRAAAAERDAGQVHRVSRGSRWQHFLRPHQRCDALWAVYLSRRDRCRCRADPNAAVDHYHHDETLQSLTGDQSGLVFSLGQSVKAELLEAEPRTGSLIFSLLEGRGNSMVSHVQTALTPSRQTFEAPATAARLGGWTPARKATIYKNNGSAG